MSAIQTSTSCLEVNFQRRQSLARSKAYRTRQGNAVVSPLRNALQHNAASRHVNDLVRQAMENDLAAQTQLFAQHRSQLYRWAYSILRNREDAEDALQDCWFRALTNLRSFRGRSSFSTWLIRIVMNSALMILRKKRSSREFSLDSTEDSGEVPQAWRVPCASPDPEKTLSEREQAALLERAIFALRPKIRDVVELVQFRGLTTTETALALGISVAAAKGRLFRARIALHRSIPVLTRHPSKLTNRRTESNSKESNRRFKEMEL